MVDSGRELAKALKDRQVQLSACFWLYSAETNNWQLVVALPQADTDGPKKAYEIIQSIIRPVGIIQNETKSFDRLLRLYLDDITVLSPSNPLVRSMSAVQFEPDSLGRQLKRSRIGDVFVDDVYVYNLSLPP